MLAAIINFAGHCSTGAPKEKCGNAGPGGGISRPETRQKKPANFCFFVNPLLDRVLFLAYNIGIKYALRMFNF